VPPGFIAGYCSYPVGGWPGGPEIELPPGRAGDRVPGVLGPLDEAADVYDDWEPALEPVAEDIELTRGDELLEEYACGGCGNGKDGNLSLTYNGRWGAAL